MAQVVCRWRSFCVHRKLHKFLQYYYCFPQTASKITIIITIIIIIMKSYMLFIYKKNKLATWQKNWAHKPTETHNKNQIKQKSCIVALSSIKDGVYRIWFKCHNGSITSKKSVVIANSFRSYQLCLPNVLTGFCWLQKWHNVSLNDLLKSPCLTLLLQRITKQNWDIFPENNYTIKQLFFHLRKIKNLLIITLFLCNSLLYNVNWKKCHSTLSLSRLKIHKT